MKKIKVGIAGSRGLSTVMGLRALPDVEITALCNLDEATLDAQAKDLGVEHKYRVFEDMLELAQVEKTMQLLAEEIEKTRRRVNALEYVKIPQMQASIKYITMKLDENERSNTIRLMKVKDMILKEAMEEKRAQTSEMLENYEKS